MPNVAQKADLNKLAKALKGVDPQSYSILVTAAQQLGRKGFNPIVVLKVVAIACLQDPETQAYGQKLDRLVNEVYESS